MKECHLVIEPSAAAAIAALLEKAKLKVGEKAVVIVSGANISLNTLGTVLSKHN
jgi:threonine dehydratase